MKATLNGITDEIDAILRPVDPKTGEILPAATVDISVPVKAALSLFVLGVATNVVTNIITKKLK